jgi:hypothetical protein
VFDPTAFQSLMQAAIKCPCEEKKIIDLTQANDLLRTISVFMHADVATLENIRLGIVSVKDLLAAAKKDNYGQRLTNLDYTNTQVKQLMQFLLVYNSLDTGNPNHTAELYHALQLFQAALTSQSKLFSDLVKTNDQILSRFKSQYGFIEASKLSENTTDGLDFINTNKLKLIPDFGFIGIFKGDNSLSFQDIVPYLGLNYNLRSIDKSISMRKVRFKPWNYYLSFHTGVTLTSLKIENKRDNLFGSFCLLTGVGVRINHIFRLTGGTVWFRSINKNPLIDDKPLAFSPYVGLSIDFELKDMFNGIGKIFAL